MMNDMYDVDILDRENKSLSIARDEDVLIFESLMMSLLEMMVLSVADNPPMHYLAKYLLGTLTLVGNERK